MFLSVTELVNLLLQYKYLIIFPIVMFEGPITTIVVGFLSSLGYFNFGFTYLLVAIADLASDALYYALGRWGRKNFIERWGHYVGITIPRIEKLESHFSKHGGKMLIFGKIADPLSSTIQTAAGMVKMPLREYIWYNVAATFPKSLILISIGFYFGEALTQINFYRQLIGIAASILGIAVLIVYFVYRRKKEKEIESYGKPES